MRLEFKADLTRFDREVVRLANSQIPFAIARAINKTAENFQETQRAHMRRVFTVRRPPFVDRAVKIKPFANKRNLTAQLTIDPPGGQSRADILTKFEQGGQKRPRSGARLAIPIGAKRGKTGIVTQANRLKAFQFEGRGKVLKGRKRTFMVRESGGDGAVLQRTGRGKSSSLKVLYAFEPQVRIRPDLRFTKNAEDVVRRRFETNFKEAWRHAVATARI